jgi:parallel beta-helix repeat protein
MYRRLRPRSTVLFCLALVATFLAVSPQARADVGLMCFGKRATIVGSNKGNTLKGTKKADVILGLGGNDRIVGIGGDDRICAGAGNDRVFGGFGNDHMNGGKGTDECLQEAGNGTKRSCEGPKFQLSVSMAGSGTGTVTSSPSAIDCGPTCVGGFFEGQKVTLTVSIVGTSKFDGWGDACSGTGPCTVLVSKAKTVIASFSAGPATDPSTSDPTCGPPCYVVTRTGDTYKAVAPSTGVTYTGGLKLVVESATRDLDAVGGGEVVFATGVFDLGGDRLSLHDIHDVEFAGQSMESTVIQNSSTEAKDSEPFDMHDTNRIVIRDMTVNAGGPFRSTSDAIDFDGGNDVIIERVKITQSRARGIVFDGKDFTGGVPRTADRNLVRNCVITSIPSDGIEFLAASQNRVEGCTITNVGGRGIQIVKSGTDPIGQGGAPVQTNKKSNQNLLIGNTIHEAGYDGIEVMSGDGNVIDGNTITNSSDNATGRDGVRISSVDNVACDDNVVRNSRAEDTQATKTQTYGLRIGNSLCNRTVVGPNNDFDPNRVGPIRDDGTDTINV